MPAEKPEYRISPLSEEYRQAGIEGAARERAIEALTDASRGRSWLEVLCAPQSEVGSGPQPK